MRSALAVTSLYFQLKACSMTSACAKGAISMPAIAQIPAVFSLLSVLVLGAQMGTQSLTPACLASNRRAAIL